MLTGSPEEIRSEARQVVKDGLKRGVEEIVANALNQWGEHGYGLPRDEAERNRLRWLQIKREADAIIARVIQFLDQYR